MSFDDKKFGTLFPTRTGTPTGTANERKMLDKMGGSEGYRKSFQTNLDGSVTQCNTRNGMPEFITRGEITPVPPKYSYYMESGQLEWSFPGEGNPTRFDPAKWHFLDIPTTSDYLGKIAGLPPVFGAQTNTPELTEGMESQAIGYPYQSDPAKVAAIKEAYGNATLMKKLTAAFFPASLFSGKMRAFIQAQYGARETQAGDPLYVEVFGESVTLLYKATIGGVTASVQFGLWSHASPGIFTAPDGKWWLLNITGGPIYTVTAYPIVQNAAGKELLKRYLDSPSEELEAYVFAHSLIDLSKAQTVGAFVGATGGPLAYGWKWNKDGSKASIVVHEVLGTGAADYRWFSSTIHLTFTQSGGVFSMSGASTGNGEWIDGWGEYNIFVPENEMVSAPLVCKSLRFDWGTYKTPLLFGGVPVYGYYVDDAWTPVTLSSTSNVAGPTYEYASSNITQSNLPGWTTPPEGVSHFGQGYWYMNGSVSCAYSIKTVTNSTGMSVSFGGSTYQGRVATSVFYKVDGVAGGVPFIPTYAWGNQTVGGVTQPSLTTYDWPGHWGGPLQESVHHCMGWDVMTAIPNVRYFISAAIPYTRTVTQTNGLDYRAWALCIPGLDAESVYITTYEYDNITSGTIDTNYKEDAEFGSTAIGFTPRWTEEELVGHPERSGYDGWWNITTGAYSSPWRDPAYSNGIGGVYTQTILGASVRNPVHNVLCFNNTVSGIAGTPGGSYYALYNCSKYYPYYDRGMWMLTSAGQRYIGSELPASPSSVEKRSFVGWA